MLAFKQTRDTQSSTYQDSIMIRRLVFIEEQNVPEDIEIDENEAACLHVVAYQNDKAVATARLYQLDDKSFKVQRVAVLAEERGKHYGNHLLLALEQAGKELGGERFILGAQSYAIPFYEKLGYVINSDEYLEAGISHYDMEKRL